MINITKPTLLLNKEQCMANITQMYEKARKSNVRFRPHFKTHNSAYIGNWFRKLGIHSITVSSTAMARYFAAYGWRDITIAFPVNPLELGVISELSNEVTLNIQGDNADLLPLLENVISHQTGFFVEIDTGHHRTGLSWKDHSEIDRMMDWFGKSTRLKFRGFLTHSGHTYHADSREEIMGIYNDTVSKMNYLKEKYLEHFPELIISIGDTPSCSLVDDFSDVDEIRPGNFVFFDLMQYSLGACTLDQVAVALACPVIGKYAHRNEIVIHGGAIHLSKDFLYKSSGERIYGYVVKISDKEWSMPVPGAYLTSLSQEHGIIRANREFIDKIRPGDVVGVLPVHSCLTANLMKGYLTLEGEAIGY